jgi:hypothetical protein
LLSWKGTVAWDLTTSSPRCKTITALNRSIQGLCSSS